MNNFINKRNKVESFTEKNLNNLFYYEGKQAVLDVLSYKLFISKKINKKLENLLEIFKIKQIPNLPVNAKTLMSEHNIPEGREIGKKLK